MALLLRNLDLIFESEHDGAKCRGSGRLKLRPVS